MFSDWETFTRVFDNKFDTWWWLGEEYYKKHGQVWPHAGESPPEGHVYPTGDRIRLAFMLAVLVTIIRFTFERLVAEPIGAWFGLRHKLHGTPAGPNPHLEELIARNRKPTPEQISSAAGTTGLTVKDVEVWVRRKQREIMPSKLNKFKEATWRLLFYSTMFIYGLTTLWKEDFFWNPSYVWVGFPDLTWAIKNRLYYYYLLEGSFYLSLMVSQFIDTKRKDFWEMFLHHIVTLGLIGGSFFGGGYKMGAVIMVTHDISDVCLEAGKVGVYLKCSWLANSGFVGFASSWFICRLVIFPVRIMYTCIFEAGAVVPNWPIHIPYTCFMTTLQVLHVYWFSLIVKMLIRLASASDGAEVDKDDRSEDEVTPPSSETEQKKDN